MRSGKGPLRFPLARAAGAAAAAALLCAPAGAASPLRIAAPVLRDCAAAQLPGGTTGVAARIWRAPRYGLLTARLRGGDSSDWDLALFSGGEPVAASTSFTSAETATAWVRRGEAITAQACRRRGEEAEVPLELRLAPVRRRQPASPRVSLESVEIEGLSDLRRLERMGFDVTHEITEDAATVALYGAADRDRLAAAGFPSESLESDLAAADRRARASEARAETASDLPSTRDTYRQYADYTTELKALAEGSPGLVRAVTLGTSLEGRPIEGVEIAANVGRRDDGRPVFLNLGAHHAREWPSAEFPMEFAIDLVAAHENPAHPLHARVRAVLGTVRVVVVPVVNVDGFIASRSYGSSAVDDDPVATAPQSAAGLAAYRRKNCRPAGDAATPCALRGSSGVDLNRNYGYWWGGPGTSAAATSQSYRGTGPFSEPEAQAVHAYSSAVQPTVVISNHTFTDTGWWLRQPGFDASFLPQGATGAITPDEPAMKALGDAMGAATGWPSDLAWELGDITGATEDWNYFAQGAYGYTPEARGPNFHANYGQMVVGEYVGDPGDAADGVSGAFLLAAETAGDPSQHAVIAGKAPAGAILRLRKSFTTPSHPDAPGDPTSPEVLETILEVGPAGAYEWHVNPSSRPDLDLGPGTSPAAETWSMTCARPGKAESVPRRVSVSRGESVAASWASSCVPAARCRKATATLMGTPRRDRLRGTRGDDVIAGLGGADRIKAGRGDDIICGGRGPDHLAGGPGADELAGGRGRDRCAGGRGRDRERGCP